MANAVTLKKRIFTLLKDPLTVFFAIGGVLFVLASDHDRQLPQNVIRVEKSNLVEFLQYRQRRFTDDMATLEWDRLPPIAQQALIDDYISEEMLVREARRLGLETNDYIIRQRLVQKLEFIYASQTDISTPDSALREWYDAHLEDYTVPARLSFQHLFFKAGPQAARRTAEAKAQLERIADDSVSETAISSDPFPYHKNYLNRPPEQLHDHFGTAFTRSLSALSPSSNWQGPLTSKHGLHLVLLSVNETAYTPDFETVKDKVAFDVRRQAKQTNQANFIDSLKNKYEIQFGQDIKADGVAQ